MLAVSASILWGLLILGCVNFLIAFVQDEKIVWNILINIGLAMFIIVISFLIGNIPYIYVDGFSKLAYSIA